jgi:hypothetical protein
MLSIFDLDYMLAFADDSFILKINDSKVALINDMKKAFESVTKWLKKSGLKVNNAKMELNLLTNMTQHPFPFLLAGQP